MTQDTQARRSAPRCPHPGAPPGIGPTIAITVICGVVCWFWLISGHADPRQGTAADVSDLTEAQDGEIAGAVTTLGLPDTVLAQFRQGKDGGCRRPLAWVSLASAPGAPPGRIRLISGTYYSPVFAVSATPVRVALPFPAPYETGSGVLTAVAAGGSATISLLPAWRVAAQDGRTTRAVTWHPLRHCRPRNG